MKCSYWNYAYLDFNDMRINSNPYYNQRAIYQRGNWNVWRNRDLDKWSTSLRSLVYTGQPFTRRKLCHFTREALVDETSWIEINAESMQNLRYADDTREYWRSTENDNRIVKAIETYGLILNIKKDQIYYYQQLHRPRTSIY